MSADFKKITSVEIEEFKAEYRARFPGRSTDDLRDEEMAQALEEMPEVLRYVKNQTSASRFRTR